MQKAIEKILEKIIENGYVAYVVGGYPRDIMLNRKSADVDICTNATPKQLKEIFPSLKMPKINYGSVTIIFNKVRFEITTFRTEKKYKDHRKPSEVVYTDDLNLDIKRRDFTINSLCMDINGNIIDLLLAMDDLKAHKIKMIGNPKTRLKEDALRILRAIRFATILNFSLDCDLEKYIIKYGHLLRTLSYERKKEELDKIFASPNCLYGIQLLLNLGLDKELELKNLDKIVVTSQIIGIWAQLGVLDLYNFNAHDYMTIKKINELLHLELNSRNIYDYGLFVSSIVAEIKGIERRKITKLHSEIPIRNKKDIAITPIEISGIVNRQPGPYLKDILNDIENAIILGFLNNDKAEIKDYIIEKYM